MAELEELQRLLLGREKAETLEGLGECLRDEQERTRFIAEVLPQALRAAQDKGERLTGALQAPVTHCIHESVQRDANRFADALYPAMGPAIRKSITETLKEFVQSLNQVLEHSFSIRGLRWRWEAMRSGVPFAEVVLKNTLLYRVEETYLIHRETGLLMDYVTARLDRDAQDEDAVSAMLTAIQDFVRDAFAGGGSNDLETLEMGERVVWVMRGPKAMMACVMRGLPPLALRERLAGLLDEIHHTYAEPLAEFAGDRDTLAGIADLLRLSLASEEREADEKKGFPWPAVVLLLLLAGLAVGAWHYLTDDSLEQARRQQLLAAIDQEPGMLVLDARLRDGRYAVRGLRDPMARPPAQVAEEAGWREEELSLNFLSYQSLDSGLLLGRVRTMLSPPDSVTLALRGDSLLVQGQAPPRWVDRVKEQFTPPAGIETVDSSELADDQAVMLSQLTAQLQPPQGVELTLIGRSLRLSGEAPLDWLLGLDAGLRPLTWLQSCSAADVGIAEWEQARALQRQLAESELFFADGVELTDDSKDQLKKQLAMLLTLQDLTHRLGTTVGLSLLGHSDGVGNRERNFWLRHQRVGLVADRLEAAGLTELKLRTEIEPRFEPALQQDPARRKVVMRVTLKGEPELPPGFCR